MNNYILISILFCLFLSIASTAQIPAPVQEGDSTDLSVSPNENTPDEVYTITEQQPSFPGGSTAMNKFITTNIEYPYYSYEREEQGTVDIGFIIEKDGSLSDIKVLRSSRYKQLDEEALRVIKKMPKWNPGMINGKPVRCKMKLPIRFYL